MNTQSLSASTIKVNLPSGILENAKAEADRIGISLQDFIRMLMGTYFANTRSIRAISQNQSLYNQAQADIQSGAYSPVSDSKALNSYLDSLDS